MRFDHRGMGDSVGELLGFQYMDADLQRAIDIFKESVPELRHIVLFGGCEAASGSMISAHQLASVKSLILANPWVNDSMQAVVSRRHYYRRLGDAQFWKKLITFQYNLLEYATGFASYAKDRIAGLSTRSNDSFDEMTEPAVPFQERMLSGFQKFNGPVLFLKSGLSLISEEFDHLVDSSKPWHKAYSRAGVKRLELPSADQTFSTAAARKEMCEAVANWMDEVNRMHATDEQR
jgi:exosortase A-associated hydrolase 1